MSQAFLMGQGQVLVTMVFLQKPEDKVTCPELHFWRT